VEQAKQAVSAILDTPGPKSEGPWFWSDQFDVKVKIAGLVNKGEVTVQRGDPSTGRFALFHCADGKVVAVESVNSASDFMAGRHLIDARNSIDLDQLSDESISLRELAS
jgi:3-phenylpropionate/trans-cinnamate dioxygenase ferredoxin reductase subunit